VLKAYGFEADVFETVRAFRERARLDDATCLVLDINLDGQCGIELSKQLAAERISIPVIFVTGDDTERTKQAALEAGCVAYLQKPFPARDLIEAIEQVS